MRPTPAPSARGWTLLSLASLAGIVSVLVLVSLSRLRGFVTRENEQDALRTVRFVAEHLADAHAQTGASSAPDLRAIVRGAGLERRLPDAVFLDGGRLMQCHGYFFTVERLPAAPAAAGTVLAEDVGGELLAVLAWPVVAGETGTALLVAAEDGRTVGHPNRDHRRGGVDGRPLLPARAGAWAREGWRPLP